MSTPICREDVNRPCPQQEEGADSWRGGGPYRIHGPVCLVEGGNRASGLFADALGTAGIGYYGPADVDAEVGAIVEPLDDPVGLWRRGVAESSQLAQVKKVLAVRRRDGAFRVDRFRRFRRLRTAGGVLSQYCGRQEAEQTEPDR